MDREELPRIGVDFGLREPEAWRLGLLLAKKGARLVGLTATLPNDQALTEFLGRASRLGLRLLRVEADYDALGGPRMLVVVEAGSSTADAMRRLEEAARQAGLVALRLVDEVSPGLWINTAVFPLLAGNERIIGLRARSLAGMASRLRARMGPGADILYYHEGRLYGEESARLYLDIMDRGDPEACVRAFLAGIQALGRARPRKVETTPKGYRFVVEDAWDAHEVGCNHTRGMIAGFMSTLLGVEFASWARVENNLCVIELEPRAGRKAPGR